MILLPIVAVAVALVLGLMALTTLGAVRRGNELPQALLAGLFFPVSWTVWYALDDLVVRREGTSGRIPDGPLRRA